jgi:hypothetical protein
MMPFEEDGPVLFAEDGSSWWPVLWGPAFAAVGAAVEALSGPVHVAAWLIIGIGLAGGAAVWVNARRRLHLVRLTPRSLTQGREHLAAERIAEVDDVGHPTGARVLGGGWSVPRKFTDVPVRLDDGTVVIAWARDGEGLLDALRRLVDQRTG